ncbi:hypothetical protein BH20ACT13_BH20ACT13_23020 [soil metagenome]
MPLDEVAEILDTDANGPADANGRKLTRGDQAVNTPWRDAEQFNYVALAKAGVAPSGPHAYALAMSRTSEPSRVPLSQTESGGHGVDIANIPGYLALPWGARWICGRAEIDGDHIVLAPGTLESIDLYERDREAVEAGRAELAVALAGVESPHDACAVARRYGLVLRGRDAQEFREPFSLWKTSAGRARLVLDLTLALEREDTDTLDGLTATWRDHLLPDSPQAQASVHLIGYAFHRLAQTVGYRSPDLFGCANCGRVVVREHGNQATYCGNTCSATAKKRRHRARAKLERGTG